MKTVTQGGHQVIRLLRVAVDGAPQTMQTGGSTFRSASNRSSRMVAMIERLNGSCRFRAVLIIAGASPPGVDVTIRFTPAAPPSGDVVLLPLLALPAAFLADRLHEVVGHAGQRHVAVRDLRAANAGVLHDAGANHPRAKQH